MKLFFVDLLLAQKSVDQSHSSVQSLGQKSKSPMNIDYPFNQECSVGGFDMSALLFFQEARGSHDLSVTFACVLQNRLAHLGDALRVLQ